MTTLYGIKNCDTVRKARRWLDQSSVEHNFHDFRQDGVNQKNIQNWLEALGAEALINKRSTTWKALSDADKTKLSDNKALIDLIRANPTLIKRPLLDHNDEYHVGFKAELYQTIFSI